MIQMWKQVYYSYLSFYLDTITHTDMDDGRGDEVALYCWNCEVYGLSDVYVDIALFFSCLYHS